MICPINQINSFRKNAIDFTIYNNLKSTFYYVLNKFFSYFFIIFSLWHNDLNHSMSNVLIINVNNRLLFVTYILFANIFSFKCDLH